MPLIQVSSERLHARIGPALSGLLPHALLGPLYRFVRCAVTMLMLTYCASAFALYKWEPALATWRAWGYFGHAVPLAVLLVTALLDVVAPMQRAGKGGGGGGKSKTN